MRRSGPLCVMGTAFAVAAAGKNVCRTRAMLLQWLESALYRVGDNANEMGEYLPFISVSWACRRQARRVLRRAVRASNYECACVSLSCAQLGTKGFTARSVALTKAQPVLDSEDDSYRCERVVRGSLYCWSSHRTPPKQTLPCEPAPAVMQLDALPGLQVRRPQQQPLEVLWSGLWHRSAADGQLLHTDRWCVTVARTLSAQKSPWGPTSTRMFLCRCVQATGTATWATTCRTPGFRPRHPPQRASQRAGHPVAFVQSCLFEALIPSQSPSPPAAASSCCFFLLRYTIHLQSTWSRAPSSCWSQPPESSLGHFTSTGGQSCPGEPHHVSTGHQSTRTEQQGRTTEQHAVERLRSRACATSIGPA